MSNDIDELQDILSIEPATHSGSKSDKAIRRNNNPADDDDDEEAAVIDSVQWEVGGNETYRPTGATTESLPPGVYTINIDNHGLFFSRINLVTDTLIDLKETASKKIVDSIRDFWKKEKKYRDRGSFISVGSWHGDQQVPVRRPQ